MEFTKQAYRQLLQLAKEHGYRFCGYHDADLTERCVILRHDIDQKVEKAVEFARVEQSQGVSSTYFVLLTSDFYNAASKKSLDGLRQIQALGHEIGLHFDECAYGDTGLSTTERILKEVGILSELLGTPVTTVSMHRPSKETLESDLKIPGIVNSYGQHFFRDYKYLSDSRRNWREPVEDIIRSEEYPRLHILTHAFWYGEQEETMRETTAQFIRSARHERYEQMAENIRDFQTVLQEEEL